MFWHFFDVLLLWLLIFPSSIHHKDIHSIQVHIHVHSILHTAGKDQPWGQQWLLLQPLLIFFFFHSIRIHSVCRDIHSVHSILDTENKDQPLD